MTEIDLNQLQQIALRLENCFQAIAQRLTDMPIINPLLQVQSVGFRRFEQACTGILITPWFMNLIWLDNNQNLTVGEKITHSFPAGAFEFIVAFEKTIGFYQSYSLFSPMFAFNNQTLAVDTAVAILKVLFAAPKSSTLSRRDLLRGAFNQNQMPS